MKELKQIKNLKHGYIFLTSILLILFAVSLSVEIYLKGGFNFVQAESNETDETIKVINKDKDSEELFIEVQNIPEGFTTLDEKITIVAFTNKDNQAWINGEKTEVSSDGVIEKEIELIIGDNTILVEVQNSDEESEKLSIVVKRTEDDSQREKDKVNKKEEQLKESPKTTPSPEPTPDPTPQPDPQLEPEPNPINGLKMSCSITNTQPYVGQSVTINCTVKDQNNNPVSGAQGSVTVNWQSGSKTYQLPSSNASGTTSVSFSVPQGNSGITQGSVHISKSGLNVSSNFSINVQ